EERRGEVELVVVSFLTKVGMYADSNKILRTSDILGASMSSVSPPVLVNVLFIVNSIGFWWEQKNQELQDKSNNNHKHKLTSMEMAIREARRWIEGAT